MNVIIILTVELSSIRNMSGLTAGSYCKLSGVIIFSLYGRYFQQSPSTLDVVLQSELPYAGDYTGFWQNPVGIQHPLAVMEIVPWDSSLVLFIANDRTVTDIFISHFPLAENLEKYNEKYMI